MSQKLDSLNKIGQKLISLLKSTKATYRVEGHSIQISANDKVLVFDVGMRKNDEFVLVADNMENLHYTQLSVVVEIKDGEVEFIDYPPYRALESHFEK